MQPALFISHGAPDLAITDVAASKFLKRVMQGKAPPDAIIIVSAHWTTRELTINGNPSPPTIHDFGGFDRKLYMLDYPAPGSPALADELSNHLVSRNYKVTIDNQKGFDHGVWVPLSLMYPAANIPVVMVSLPESRPMDYYYELGRSLKEFRNKNILIMGSGGITHNLYDMRIDGAYTAPEYVNTFAEWVNECLLIGETTTLFNYQQHRYGRKNHPTPEHFLPLFIAMGAGDKTVDRLHTSVSYGVLRMDCYQFE